MNGVEYDDILDDEHYAEMDRRDHLIGGDVTAEDMTEGGLDIRTWNRTGTPTVLQHLTEQKCPVQAAGFRDIIEEMYQTHLDKNADYSPANVLGVGEIGIIVRLWDKMTRLMNLTGFDVKVEFLGYTKPKEAKNESIEDTYMDMGVYSIIGRLYREGKWGR